MMTVSDSGVGLTPGFHGGARHSRAVTAHAAVKADACRCGPKVVLPESGRTFTPNPVYYT